MLCFCFVSFFSTIKCQLLLFYVLWVFFHSFLLEWIELTGFSLLLFHFTYTQWESHFMFFLRIFFFENPCWTFMSWITKNVWFCMQSFGSICSKLCCSCQLNNLLFNNCFSFRKYREQKNKNENDGEGRNIIPISVCSIFIS